MLVYQLLVAYVTSGDSYWRCNCRQKKSPLKCINLNELASGQFHSKSLQNFLVRKRHMLHVESNTQTQHLNITDTLFNQILLFLGYKNLNVPVDIKHNKNKTSKVRHIRCIGDVLWDVWVALVTPWSTSVYLPLDRPATVGGWDWKKVVVLYELGPQRESDTQQQQQIGKESDGRDEVGREEKVMSVLLFFV